MVWKQNKNNVRLYIVLYVLFFSVPCTSSVPKKTQLSRGGDVTPLRTMNLDKGWVVLNHYTRRGGREGVHGKAIQQCCAQAFGLSVPRMQTVKIRCHVIGWAHEIEARMTKVCYSCFASIETGENVSGVFWRWKRNADLVSFGVLESCLAAEAKRNSTKFTAHCECPNSARTHGTTKCVTLT